MTFRGLCITFFELFLIVLALGTEIKEFLVVAMCIGGLFLYSLISLVLASVTLEVKSKTNKAAALRGESVKYHILLKGFVIFPVAAYLSVKSADINPKKKRRLKHSFLMMPTFLMKRDFVFELPCTHIGNWKVGIKKLRFEDIFGLFSLPLLRADKKDFTADLAVMPRVHILEETEETISSGGYGNSSSSSAEEGELLGDSRAYREGDSLKRINWKQSARTKSLYTRQYEMLQKPKIVIAVDTAFCSQNICDMVDISYETAITLSNYFVEEMNNVELITLRCKNDSRSAVFPLKSKNDIEKMQYDFTNVFYHSTKNELRLDALDDTYFLKADKIFFITDNPSQQLLSDIKDMNKNGKTVKCIKPKTLSSAEEIMIEEGEEFVTVISAVDLISKKAGAAL